MWGYPLAVGAAVTAPPVRIQRKGPLKWFHPSRDELRAACLYAESEARHIAGMNEVDLAHYLNWCIGEQLNVGVNCTIIGEHDLDDAPVVRVQTEHYTHHIAVRGIKLKAPPPTPAEQLVADTKALARAIAAELGKHVGAPAKVR